MKHGLCRKWKQIWHNGFTKQEAIAGALSFDGMEYLHKTPFISNEYLLENFSEYINNGSSIKLYDDELKGSMYINYKGDINFNEEVLFIRDSVAIVTIHDSIVCNINIFRESRINIRVGKDSIVFINGYDNGRCLIEGSQSSKVIVRLDSDMFKVLKNLI